MGFFEALVAIAAIGAFVWMRTMRHRERGGAAPLPPRDGQLEAEVRRLGERVAVLERIVTEERSERNLASEIEKLRG